MASNLLRNSVHSLLKRYNAKQNSKGLSPYADEEKERRTTEAMQRGEPLIYGGRIKAGDLLGNPDLLQKQGDGYC